MRMIALIAALTFAPVLAIAQHDHSQHDSGTPAAGKMTEHDMMSQHAEMSELMAKMMESMKAIDNEKDPANLRPLLDDHKKLMEQMRDQMGKAGAGKADAGMKKCMMMGNEEKAASK
jgi:hypothetical protein